MRNKLDSGRQNGGLPPLASESIVTIPTTTMQIMLVAKREHL